LLQQFGKRRKKEMGFFELSAFADLGMGGGMAIWIMRLKF
jgi:hypothetical protein